MLLMSRHEMSFASRKGRFRMLLMSWRALFIKTRVQNAFVVVASNIHPSIP
jgi:hypothetical protein